MQSLYREFQSEKEDLLDSIRLLGHQVLLKDAIIAAFIPQVGDTRPTGGGGHDCNKLAVGQAGRHSTHHTACGCVLGYAEPAYRCMPQVKHRV